MPLTSTQSVNSVPLRTAHLSLGSNLDSPAGGPVETILAAMGRLRGLGEVSAVSSLYLTEPVDFHPQPAFVNAAVELRTGLDPLPLLRALLLIERAFGRDRSTTPGRGPRTLDLDLLLVEDEVIRLPELTLPHPAMAERRFVLQPLAEIAAAAVHPVLGATIAELLAALPADEGPNRREAVVRLDAVSADAALQPPGDPAAGKK